MYDSVVGLQHKPKDQFGSLPALKHASASKNIIVRENNFHKVLDSGDEEIPDLPQLSTSLIHTQGSIASLKQSGEYPVHDDSKAISQNIYAF